MMNKRKLPEDFRSPTYGLNKNGLASLKNDGRFRNSPGPERYHSINIQANTSYMDIFQDRVQMQMNLPVGDNTRYPGGSHPRINRDMFCAQSVDETNSPLPSFRPNFGVGHQSRGNQLPNNRANHSNVRPPMPTVNPIRPPTPCKNQHQYSERADPQSHHQVPGVISNSSTGKSKSTGRNPSLRIFTGGVERTLQWIKIFGRTDLPILFEVLGKVRHIRANPVSGEMVFSLSELEQSSLLQVSYFEIDRPLQNVVEGALVKVVGSLRGKSCIQAFTVLPANLFEFPCVHHVAYICDCSAKDLKL